ncbi:uncharacterized protein LOC115230326 [Argonauta hians]
MNKNMSPTQSIWMFVAWFLGIIALALVSVSISSNNWIEYNTNTTDISGSSNQIRISLGMWWQCTEDKLKDGWSKERCSSITFLEYRDTEVKYINYSFVIFVCISAFVQLCSKVLLLVTVPSCCRIKRKIYMLFSLSLLEILAALCGIVGCICFIAQENMRYDIPKIISIQYQWGFMLAWISIGLCFVQSAIYIVIIKFCYDNVFQSGKFDYATMPGRPIEKLPAQSTSSSLAQAYLQPYYSTKL